MPEGPATGRVEATRRALTTPSPAPASKTRWCDAWIWVRKRDAPSGKTCNVHEPISVRHVGHIVPANVDTKTCTWPARSPCTNCSRHRWCSDIGTGTLGRGGRERRLSGARAAKFAAPSGCTRFALTRQPGVRECLERASRKGGQPDATFAWPPSWSRHRGPSCR